MNISAKTWNEYITRLARLNEKAGQLMADYIARHGTADTAALVAYAEALVTKYGEGSAELACQMYDAIAALQRAGVPPAEPATPAGHSEVARMVQATRNSPPQLRQGVSRMVKQAAADTTVRNALRDGAEWAWVPHGDTCPFCLTLASRGWQKASNAVLKGGHAKHIHANCDCEFAIRFDGRTGVAGYDPERYLAQYNAAEGKTAEEKLKSLRRANYAANKDRINGQKRMAYSLRKQNTSEIKAALNHLDDVASKIRTKVQEKAVNGAVKDYTNGNEDAIIIKKLRDAANLPETATIHLEPVPIDVDALTFDDAHINKERHHNVSEKQAKQYIRNAKISVTVWNGQFERYYGADGTAYVDTAKKEIRAAYSSAEYTENLNALIKEMESNGILG